MNFADLNERCPGGASLPGGGLILGEELVTDLFAADRRCFFRLCQSWVKGGPGPEVFPRWDAFLAALTPRRRQMADLHLACAGLVRAGANEAEWEAALPELAARSGCHPQLVRDVLAELHGPLLESAAPGSAILGAATQSIRAARTQSLMLAETGHERGWGGVAARLAVEALPCGPPGLFPSAAFAFVDLDDDFRQSLNLAWELALRNDPGIFPGAVRWALPNWTACDLEATSVAFTRLCGNSAGGAALLVLSKLAAESGGSNCALREIATQNVAVVAALGPGGTLLPVACLGLKTLAALQQRVHTLAVASTQGQIPDRFNPSDEVKGLFKDSHHDVSLVFARDMEEMLQRLLQSQASSFAHVDCKLPPRDGNFVGRERLTAELDQFIRVTSRGYLVLVGGIGTGKSAFLIEFLHREHAAERTWAYHLVKEESTPEEAAQCLYDRLRRNHAIQAAPEWQPLSPGRRLRLLLEEISRRLEGTGRKEVFFIDAADQLRLQPKAPFLPGVLFDLPPNILGIITTNNRLEWLNTLEHTTRWDMADYLDDRVDIRNYLERMNSRARLGLGEEFMERIFQHSAPLIFFTVEANVRQLQSSLPDRHLLTDPSLWWQLPREKILREIRRAEGSLHYGHVPSSAVRFALGALALRYEDLSNEQMSGLGLHEPMHRALTVGALDTFLRPLPATHSAQAPRSFCHPEYVRVIRDLIADAQKAECHDLWAKGCARVWPEPRHPARGYALRHLLPHLRQARDWNRLTEFLTDFRFLGLALGVGLEGRNVAESARPAATQFAAIFRQFEKSLRLGALPEDHPRRHEAAAIFSALAQSTHVLKEDPQQIFQQLRNHLPAGSPLIARLDQLLQQRARPWLERINPPAAEDEARIFRLVQPASGAPRQACFLERGRRIASGSDEGSIQVFSTRSLSDLEPLQRMGGAVTAMATSPDGRQLAWSAGPTAWLWHRDSERQLRPVRREHGRITCLAISSRGLLVTADDRGSICLHEVASRRLVRECQSHTDAIHAVAFSPDGRWLASVGADHRLVLQDTITGQEVVQSGAHESWVEGVAFSPDGRRLATGGGVETGEVKLWQFDPAAGQLTFERSLPCLPSGLRCLISVTNHTGDWLLACGSHCGIVRIIELNYGEAVFTCSPGATVLSLDFSVRENLLVSTCDNGEVKLWQLPTLRRSGSSSAGTLGRETESTYTIGLSPDGGRAISAGRIGLARLWEVATGQPLRNLIALNTPINQVAFSPTDPGQVAVTSNGEVRLLDVRDEHHVVQCRGHQKWVVALRFSPCGRWLVSGGQDGNVLLHDARDGRFIAPLVGSGVVVALAVTADARQIAVSTGDGSLRLFDRSADPVASTLIHSGPRMVTAVEFSPDGKFLAWGEATGEISVRPVGGTSLSDVHRGHHAKINALAFSPDSKLLASGGADGELRVWQNRSERAIAWTTCTHHVMAILFAGPPYVLHVADKGGANLAPNLYRFGLREF